MYHSFMFLMCHLAILLLTAMGSHAQPVAAVHTPDFPVEIATDKTTILVFAAPICEGGVDRGHPDILARSPEGISNVLKVKAAQPTLPFSSLTVFTTDGRIYCFKVCYVPDPWSLVLDMTQHEYPGGATAIFSHHRMNDARTARTCEMVAALPSFTRGRRARPIGNMHLQLNSIYLQEGVLFFRFTLVNVSRLPYHTDFIRCYVRDRRRSRRTSSMEKEMTPLKIYQPGDSAIRYRERRSLILAFEQFTIANNKRLSIELFEQNGDRHLTIHIRGQDILRARALQP